LKSLAVHCGRGSVNGGDVWGGGLLLLTSREEGGQLLRLVLELELVGGCEADRAGASKDVDGGVGDDGGRHGLGDGFHSEAHPLGVFGFVFAGAREELLGVNAGQVGRSRSIICV